MLKPKHPKVINFNLDRILVETQPYPAINLLKGWLADEIVPHNKLRNEQWSLTGVNFYPYQLASEDPLNLDQIALPATLEPAIGGKCIDEPMTELALSRERERIGMELHDGVIQSIFAIGLKLESLRTQVPPSSALDIQVQSLLTATNQVIDDIRLYISNQLHKPTAHLTLPSELENIAHHFRDYAHITVVMAISEELPCLTDNQQHHIHQIVSEGLANIARHAAAQAVLITLQPIGDEVVLTIKDDGQGFDMDNVSTWPPGHFGLCNMQQRAHQLKGTLMITSRVGDGTTIAVHFPFTSDPADSNLLIPFVGD